MRSAAARGPDRSVPAPAGAGERSQAARSRPATRAQASIREVVLRFIVSSSLQDVAPSEGTQVGKQRGAPRLVQAAKALPGDGGLATVPQDGLDEVARPAVVQIGRAHV